MRWAALEAFRQAAEAGSFRAAGRKLGITPSAISHQIRKLEAEPGTPSFIRGVRSVTLTAAGAALAAATASAYDGLEAVLGPLRGSSASGRLRVSALPLFTHAWLFPGWRGSRPPIRASA